jgi:rhodanese-related sulfurtransferase
MSRTLFVTGFLGAAIAGIALLAGVVDLRAMGMEWLRRLIRRRFPKVKQLSTAELAEQLNDGRVPAPLIYDVREPHEYAVSHLPTAQRLNPKISPGELVPTLPQGQPVVFYCSVGYRSSRLATRLIESGFINVSNLEGSIFRWANEGRPLERDGRVVKVVHPYSAWWRWLVRSDARAPLRRSA